jgi:hypothetical protein
VINSTQQRDSRNNILSESTCKHVSEHVNDDWHVYYYANGIQPDLRISIIVNENTCACAKSVAQREYYKGSTPLSH